MATDAMAETVPIRTSISDLYPPENVKSEETRWSNLRATFRSRFGHEPTFVARSPGRVNLLGEHIDYSLYDCLPAGIAADVIIAVSASPASSAPATFHLASTDPKAFEPCTFSLEADGSVAIDAAQHHWSNYFKAGLRGALGHLAQSRPPVPPVGLSAVVDGTVPPGGGLSSSAALVCASALAALHAAGVTDLGKRALVELAIVAERAVGVNSGGLDQTGSVCSRRGCALHVAFSPALRAEAIPFPKTDPEFAILIAQSLVESNKRETGPVCYNLRVVEVSLAAQYLAARLGVTLAEDAGPLGCSLRGFQLAYFASEQAPQDLPSEEARLEHLLGLVETHLPDVDGYDRAQIARTLGISVDELKARYLTKFPVRCERFRLRQRAQHVAAEAIRVQQFVALLQAPPADGGALLRRLGALMNATQASCRDVYECSCPELDALCRIARDAGTYGSRLTGAGWGGCTVHLVPKDRVGVIQEALHREYYAKRFPDLEERKLEQAVVVTEPGHGAMVLKLL